jgi:hypothetical protein
LKINQKETILSKILEYQKMRKEPTDGLFEAKIYPSCNQREKLTILLRKSQETINKSEIFVYYAAKKI